MSAPDAAAALFVKAPRAGHAKTRLGASIGLESSAALYAAFVEDTLATLRAMAHLEVTLWVAREDDRTYFAERGLPLEVQPAGGLGARMQAALTHGLRSASVALVIGSDSPTLPAACVRSAIRALDEAAPAAVFAPTPDGGYCIVGARGRSPRFDDVRWSGPHALADSMESARREGLRVALSRPHYDVDTEEDLRLLQLELGLDSRRAPHTRRTLERADFDRTRRP